MYGGVHVDIHLNAKKGLIVFKFIGAMTVGLLTMCAVGYYVMRPAEERTSDFDVAKSLFTTVVEGVKNYFHNLFNPTTAPEVV